MKYTFLILLSAIWFSGCSQSVTDHDSVLVGNGEYIIENESFIYDYWESKNEDTYILVSGDLDMQPDASSLEKMNSGRAFARIEIQKMNDQSFNINNPKYLAFPGGTIYFNRDSTVTYEIKMRKRHFEHSNIKELTDSIYLTGVYFLYGDTIPHTIEFSARMSNKKLNLYERYIRGEIESQLGIKVDKSLIKGLVFNHYDYLYSGMPQELGDFTSLENVTIRGLMNDEPFPVELFELKNLERIDFDITNINKNGTPKHQSTFKFFLPPEILELPKLKTIEVNHCQAMRIPDFPEDCTLENFEVFSHCKVDSLPHSIINATELKKLNFHLGVQQSVIPADLNQLTKLESLIINIVDCQIPDGFGPWPNLKEVRIVQHRTRMMGLTEFNACKYETHDELARIFNGTPTLIIDGTKY